MALFGASHFMDGDGIVIAFFLGALGAAGASLSRWRTEPGLWMLAVLFLVLFFALYLTFCYGQLRDAWNGAPRVDLVAAAEFAVATLLLVTLLRFLTSVAMENYCLSKSRNDKLGDG
jgi:hypothetical protein